MDQFFATLFQDVRHETSLILLLSLTDPDILKQSKFTDHENDIIKNRALQKLYRQRILKVTIAWIYQKNNFLINK